MEVHMDNFEPTFAQVLRRTPPRLLAAFAARLLHRMRLTEEYWVALLTARLELSAAWKGNAEWDLLESDERDWKDRNGTVSPRWLVAVHAADLLAAVHRFQHAEEEYDPADPEFHTYLERRQRGAQDAAVAMTLAAENVGLGIGQAAEEYAKGRWGRHLPRKTLDAAVAALIAGAGRVAVDVATRGARD
jgi:hypothetical protein